MDQYKNLLNVEPEENRATILFLGLFLIILCFFILLVSISTIEDNKSKDVMESISSTFANITDPVTEPVKFVSKAGVALGPEAFLSTMAGVFTTTIKVDKVQIVQPGRIMTVSIQSEELFADDKVALRSTRQDLIDRIVASLSAVPEGMKFEMVVIMGSPIEDGTNFTITENLSLERVGAFLRVVIERGADPASLSGGIKPGSASDVIIQFSIYSVDVDQ